MLSPKLFYRRVESLLDRVVAGSGSARFSRQLPAALLEEFASSLGVQGVQLFERQREGWRPTSVAGTVPESSAAEVARVLDPAGEPTELPAVLGRLGLINADGFVLAQWFDDAAAEADGTRMLWLSALQHALNERLQRRALEDIVEQARIIQTSLLPLGPPAFGDYDLAAVSLPARVVGGDAYDYIALDDDTLAIAIADASGHGLPAALQARDVVVGIRMGVERDLRITRMIEKLNRVIHASGLSSRFVSLVFGELERNGNFAYINAGHPPPRLLDDSGMHELSIGGLVLGAVATTPYKQGFAHLDRGAAMVLVTDGVLEHGTERGDAFGDARLCAWLEAWREGPAQTAVADLIERLRAHGGGEAFEDDVTVVFVRRPRAV